MLRLRCLSAAAALVLAAGAATASPAAAPIGPADMVRAEGRHWVRADGTPVTLRGANLGNWLINEFWMMGQGSNGIDDECKLEAVLDRRFGYEERQRLMPLFRDSWMTEQDWDRLAGFGVNLVRVPFIHTVVEDERHPGRLRADAWRYLDRAVDEAGKRGMHVVLDLHGAAGSQGWEHHSGCAGRNQYWSRPEYQARTAWLWKEVAGRYRDNPVVAGYSLLNEPWGTDPANLAAEIRKLYDAVRAADPNHVIILPGHNTGGIDGYGNPAQQGMRNVAFEIHPYPGHFGWGKPGPQVHRGWLRCLDARHDTVCKWDARMRALETPLFIGEMQPWAGMDLEQGGRMARASFDTYGRLGWAATAWAYKYVSNFGGYTKNGRQLGTWGMVTNAAGERIPALDFNTAPLDRIEALFRRFGSLRSEAHGPLRLWMTTTR